MIGPVALSAVVWCAAPRAAPPPPPAASVETPPSSASLGEDYVPPFRSDPVSLSEVLQHAVEHNPDVAMADVDVEISEARILGALGAFDVQLVGTLEGQFSEFPQRGSQLSVALSSRRVGGGFSLRRRVETGGSVSLGVDTGRSRTEQPVDLFDPTQGQATLKSYAVVPTLRLQHSVLRGAGLKINRAPIEQARIAKTAAEAQRQSVAQTVARDIILAYWDLLYAHRDLANKRGSVALVQKQYDATLALVRAGRRSKMDSKVAQQGLVAREADVLASEQALLQASVRLRSLMGDEVADADRLGLLPTTDPVVEARAVM
ncbi:MAG: TolC family protein, partial [Myxococcota bacterium]